MPPFASSILSSSPIVSSSSSKRWSGGNIVTLNVGGQIFQTTRQTLALAGPDSLLAAPPPFIDRDPDLFSLLLSLLRTNRLPSVPTLSLSDLIAEANFYGIDPSLLLSSSSFSHFDALDLAKSHILPLNGRDAPSAVAVHDPSGALHVAHAGKITSFDPSLSRKSTLLTTFTALDSLLALDRPLIAAGAVDFPGIQILDTATGRLRHTLHWNVTGSGSAAVQAIGSSPDYLFGSFESIRRNSSAIAFFDRTNFKQVGEIGRKEIYGADLDSAIPPTKLKWISGFNLLLAAGSHAGPSGLTGTIRLWDVRTGGGPVWETTEKADCFADVAVSDALSAMFKVGVRSGEVFMRDLRKLSSHEEEAPWVSIGEGRRSGNGNANHKEGSGCLVESHGEKVFVSRGGDVEIWSEVVMGRGMRKNEHGFGSGERVMRRNLMGRREDVGGKRIVKLGFGGGRMVVLRKEEQQCVEVWENSASASAFRRC